MIQTRPQYRCPVCEAPHKGKRGTEAEYPVICQGCGHVAPLYSFTAVERFEVVPVEFTKDEAKAIMDALHMGQIVFGAGPTQAAIERLRASIATAEQGGE